MLSPIPTKDVCDFLGSLQEKHFRQLWTKILGLLQNPRPHDSQKIATIDNKDTFRTDVGEFRIIYMFDLKYLRLLLIGKRNDSSVYKDFKRKYQ